MKRALPLLFFFVWGCGYHYNSSLTSIKVPYVQGDTKGIFTQELIYQLVASGRFHYGQQKDALRLHVEIKHKSQKQIGYRHDRENAGKVLKNLVATEGRESIFAEMTLLSADGDIVLGPLEVQADADYDYIDQNALRDITFVDQNGQTRTVLSFSLGQLEGIDAAQMAVEIPVYRALAQKIVEALMQKERG